MKTASNPWRVILSVMVLFGALGGPLAAARAEEPEPPLATYDDNWTGGTQGLAIGSATAPNGNPPPVNVYIEMADDVVLPAGSTYGLITNVNVDGEFFGDTPINSVNVRFYSDASNLPGTLVYSQTANITTGASTGDFQLALPSAAALRTSQRYWLSVHGQFSIVDGNWFWATRSIQTGNPAAMRRSAESNCQNVWVTRAVCEPGPPTNGYGPDLYFQLTYTPFTPTDFTYLPIISR